MKFASIAPALSVSGPGALCVGLSRCLSGPGALCVGPRRSLWGPVLARSLRQAPVLSVSGSPRRSLCRCVCGPRHSLCRAPADALCVRHALCRGPALFALGPGRPGPLCDARRSLCRGRSPPLSESPSLSLSLSLSLSARSRSESDLRTATHLFGAAPS